MNKVTLCQNILLTDAGADSGALTRFLGIQPHVKSLRSSYTGLYPQTAGL